MTTTQMLDEIENNKIKTEIKSNIFSNLTLYYGILVFFGFFHQSVYYHQFGINILDYLEIGEVVTSFFDILTSIVIVFIVIISIASFILRVVNDKPLGKVFYIVATISIVIIYLILELAFKQSTIIKTLKDLMIVSFVGLISIILLYKTYIRIKNIIKISIGYFRLFIIFLVSLLLLWASARLDSYLVRDGVDIIYVLTNDGKNYKTETDRYFIGKTKNYIFYFVNNKPIVVIPVKEVKEIQINCTDDWTILD